MTGNTAPGRSLAQNTGFVLAAELVVQGTRAATVFILFRVLGDEQFGVYAGVLALLTLLGPASQWGMVLGHIGFAVTLVGVALVSHYETERDISIEPGQTVNVGEYDLTFEHLKHREGPNYDSDHGVFTVSEDGERVTQVVSEKRFYRVQRMSMTEVGLDSGLLRDLYVAMGEPLEQGQGNQTKWGQVIKNYQLN